MSLPSFERSNRQEDFKWCLLLCAQIVTERNPVLLPLYRLSQKNPSLNPVRKDIAMLYTFVGLLSAALPEESVFQFLGQDPLSNKVPLDLHDKESVESISGRLPTFIQRAVWSRSTLMQDLNMSVARFMTC